MAADGSRRHAQDEGDAMLAADELGEGQGYRHDGSLGAAGIGGSDLHRWDDNAQAAASSHLVEKGRQIFGLNLADAAVVRHLSINALLIALWYFFSLSISLYNQWMFSGKHLNFKFPLFTTSMHMLVQFVLASAVLYFLPRFRPQLATQRPRSASAPSIRSDSDASSSDAKRPLMSRWFYLTRIGPCGAATGLDIGLGNTSMRFITLTFYTMCKSSVLGFVLLFAFVFGLERPSVRLLGIIAVMTGGVVLMVAGETDFNLQGFLLIMTSAAFSGFRWALTQILLLRNPATGNPFLSLFFLAPVMFFTLFIIAVPAEGIPDVIAGLRDLTQQQGTVRSALLLAFPGTLAFCMTASEFALLKRTSVVTLSVCGIFKEVVTIVAAQSTLDHDRMTPVNLAGLAITIASIAVYNYIKIRKMREEAEAELTGGDGASGVSSSGVIGGAGGAAAAGVGGAGIDAEEERPMLAGHDDYEERAGDYEREDDDASSPVRN